MIQLVFQKLKAFRMTLPSLILLVLASCRTLMSGYSIELVGVCASVVPFVCQFRNFPRAPEDTDTFADVLSSYLLNLLLMALYLGWVLLLTFIGSRFFPGYTVNPHFMEMLLIAVCADVVFISVLIPVCHDLQPMQRIMSGILLCNAQLVFMMLAGDYVEAVQPPRLMAFAGGFIALILVLTLNFMLICYRIRKPAK